MDEKLLLFNSSSSWRGKGKKKKGALCASAEIREKKGKGTRRVHIGSTRVHIILFVMGRRGERRRKKKKYASHCGYAKSYVHTSLNSLTEGKRTLRPGVRAVGKGKREGFVLTRDS